MQNSQGEEEDEDGDEHLPDIKIPPKEIQVLDANKMAKTDRRGLGFDPVTNEPEMQCCDHSLFFPIFQPF